MKIRSVTFLKSATAPEDFNGVKEIAFVGRSNVGKSSLINYLTNSKIAKSSKTPGRTRLINYFGINNNECLFVDLPGYGFSLAGKKETQSWGNMIEGYLKESKNLVNILFLLDIRLKPSQDDLMMMQYMVYYNIPFTIVATKADKLSRAEANRAMQLIATTLKVGVDNIFLVSSEKRTGAEEILSRLDQFLTVN